MTNYYECHVTCEPKDKEKIERLANVHKFKTSVLKGDEFMGDDKLMYCTAHDRFFDNLHVKMENLIADFKCEGIPILRKKIEHVILDERYKK